MARVGTSAADDGARAMTDRVELDPQYVVARRVLLDALSALAPHGKAVIVVGAQAIYLRTGLNDLAIAPYTTDGDLALDPTLLGDEPELEASMGGAGFRLWEPDGGNRTEPGIWVRHERIGEQDLTFPIDLIVPEAAAADGGRRGARLGVHGNRAARRAIGLEAALIDHGAITVSALEPNDDRRFDVEVAGLAALIVAKAHKIHDRAASGRTDRLSDKDAADVFRIMQTARPDEVASTLRELLADPIAGTVTDHALTYMDELFGRRAGIGVVMAQRALRLAVDEAQVATLCVAFAEQVRLARA